MNTIREQLGRAKTILYRKPKDELRRLIRWGPRGYFRCDAWAREMERAARVLPILKPEAMDSRKVVRVWFLTGRKFWYQTAFCAWTFAKHSRHAILPLILDDGTLDEECIDGLRRLFPDMQVHRAQACDDLFRMQFPLARYQNINGWRTRQILFRKLTDIHAGSNEFRVFFDSDMLFHSRPYELDDYFDKPEGCLFQTDCWESYGYSRGLVENLCGHPLPIAANIGIFSLHGQWIDWDQVESWLGEMQACEGTQYNVTQCLCAMLMAGNPQFRLDKEQYKVWPKCPTNGEDGRKLGHYVSDSKPWYFGQAWKLGFHADCCSDQE